MARAPKVDIRFEDHGSLWLVRPMSRRGKRWAKEHIQSEDWQWLGGAIAVEPRYVPDIAQGAQQDGLNVEKTT